MTLAIRMAAAIATAWLVGTTMAQAQCVRGGVVWYSSIFYVGRPYTSVDGAFKTSENLQISLKVAKCLRPNTKYNLTSTAFTSRFFFDGVRQLTNGDPKLTFSGYVITDSHGLPSAWFLEAIQKPAKGQVIDMLSRSANLGMAVDSALHQIPGPDNGFGYVFANGSWYAS